ncbi:MAG: XRE family transcriptional regulator [Oscillospiraceae bacterium]
MQDTVSTDKLENELSEITDISDYIEKNSDNFINVKLSEYLKKLIGSRNMEVSQVIKDSGLNRIYAYQILEGGKNPSRDKIIALAFGMKLNFGEIQKLLKTACARPLYARDERDSVIIFAVKRGRSIIETNLLLEEHGFKSIE